MSDRPIPFTARRHNERYVAITMPRGAPPLLQDFLISPATALHLERQLRAAREATPCPVCGAWNPEYCDRMEHAALDSIIDEQERTAHLRGNLDDTEAEPEPCADEDGCDMRTTDELADADDAEDAFDAMGLRVVTKHDMQTILEPDDA